MKINQNVLRLAFLLQIISFFILLPSCSNNDSGSAVANKSDTLTDEQMRLPENALRSLIVAEGLQIKTMATEPLLKNPTNIDVDDRGRVWVNEAYNYRPDINGNPVNSLGDRIMILEDTNGDGVTDTAKVFYQGPELDAPLGISVLGNRVIVSQSPYIWMFYDDNGDDKADRKEILFQGISGEQHDHGAHAFTFGPDGKLYFNLGNEGKQLRDKNNKPVLDQDGDAIDQKKYKQGLVFRCDLDGTNVEFLGQNFRNPYEVAVDSYGTLWQSDNDDDGNRGTRINYVMQYGNYGYTDETTGAGWRANRTNIEDSIPLRHWHLNDPGSVPNLLQTFAGSPTGILVYEGSLLPKEFQNQIIHCEPGQNVVRSYLVANNGAGYSAVIKNILKDEKDQWFRPADLCAAPDGSLIVADWYDPGVGGHQAGDQTRGRLYRVAPDVSTYKIQQQDYSSVAGAIAALQNPNLSVRYYAFTALQKMGVAAIPELEKLWHDVNANPRMRARAFWVLVKINKANASQYIQEAVKEGNSDLRIMAIRGAHQNDANDISVIKSLINDPNAQVRRECALALRHNKNTEAASLWASLATQYDGKDRWYLEALGIGADRQWNNFFAAYLDKIKDPSLSAASKDIVWRARTDAAIPYLATFAADKQTALDSRLKYFRAFDFHAGSSKSAALLKMISDNSSSDVALNKLVLHALDKKAVSQSAVAQKALTEVLQSVTGTDEYIELVSQYEVKSQKENLLTLAVEKSNENIGKDAAGLLLRLGGGDLVWKILNSKETDSKKDNLLTALAHVGSKESIDVLQAIALSDKYDMTMRKNAAHKIGNSWSGEERVLAILKAKKVPKELIADVVASVDGAWRGNIRTEAASYLPDKGKTKASKPAPTMQEIALLKPDASAGQKVYTSYCAVCHKINNSGNDFGPKLSEIGSKLPKEALLESIVNPSAGIGFGYEGWIIKMKDGSSWSGIISSKTETDIEMVLPGGTKKQIKTADLLALTQMKESIMTEGLHQNMSTQDMSNLLAYLESLKKK